MSHKKADITDLFLLISTKVKNILNSKKKKYFL